MASITIRRLEDTTKEKLRIRASRHGRSMEAEAREILTVVLRSGEPPERNLAEAIRRRFAALGGVELPPVPREPMREAPKFGK